MNLAVSWLYRITTINSRWKGVDRIGGTAWHALADQREIVHRKVVNLVVVCDLLSQLVGAILPHVRRRGGREPLGETRVVRVAPQLHTGRAQSLEQNLGRLRVAARASPPPPITTEEDPEGTTRTGRWAKLRIPMRLAAMPEGAKASEASSQLLRSREAKMRDSEGTDEARASDGARNSSERNTEKKWRRIQRRKASLLSSDSLADLTSAREGPGRQRGGRRHAQPVAADRAAAGGAA